MAKSETRSPRDLYKLLNEPFDPADIKWKPQTVNYSKKTAMAIAHADPRAYTDRLNEVLGPDGWSQEFTFTVTPFVKFIKGKKAYKETPATEDKTVAGNKVLCICRLTIPSVGTHSSTGDCDASDENAATSAEAQAFKRACVQFGLGRYLYDLPKITVPFDYDKGGFIAGQEPQLPDWAIPVTRCEDCTGDITSGVFQDKEYSVTQIVNNAVKKYDKKLCMTCQRKRAEASKTASGTRLA
jgi:hypothetical protein